MFILKAYRGSATFEQFFTNHDAFLDKQSWLKANGFTIGQRPNASDSTKASLSSALVYGGH